MSQTKRKLTPEENLYVLCCREDPDKRAVVFDAKLFQESLLSWGYTGEKAFATFRKLMENDLVETKSAP